jgi:hypothetical protein
MRLPERQDAGSVLLLVCVLLFLMLTFILVLAEQTLKDSSRRADVGDSLKNVYGGIVGDSSVGTFGYLGDVGDYPSSLLDLIQNPGVTGWNGPYFRNARLDGGMVYGPYGAPLEYFTSFANGSLDKVTVISRGPDHDSSNTAANPNVSAQFTGTLPTSGLYASANPDNVAFPDFNPDTNALQRETVGSLIYDIQNFDQNSLQNSQVAGCPGLYSLRITSVPRGSADTTTLTYPSTLYAQSLEAQLLQGVYDVEVISEISVTPIWKERVVVYPGATLRRQIVAPRIDSSTSPGFSLTVFNNGSNTATVRVFGSSQGTVTTGVGIRTFSVKACSAVTVTQSSTTWDTFIMPYGSYTRAVKNPPLTSYTLTVTNGGTNDDVIQVVHAGMPGYPSSPKMVLGTVFKRKTQTFVVPAATTNHTPSNSGVVIEFQKRDGTVISSPTYTGDTTVTVP